MAERTKARPPWRGTRVPPLPRPALCGSWNTPACPLGLCRCRSPRQALPLPCALVRPADLFPALGTQRKALFLPLSMLALSLCDEGDPFQEARRLMRAGTVPCSSLSPHARHTLGTRRGPGPPCPSRRTHFLPGRHGPFSTWDLSKPTRIVLLPSHSLQALPTPLRTHPLLPEAFSNPSPGARPPSGARHADPQLHCTFICRLLAPHLPLRGGGCHAGFTHHDTPAPSKA